MAEFPTLLTIAEVAGMLKCSREAVRQKCVDGELPAIRIRGSWRILEEQLESARRSLYGAYSVVYVVRQDETDYFKIGFSGTRNGAQGRLRDLQVGNPIPLTLYAWANGTIKDEKKIHDHLKKYRVHGEWFNLNDQLLGELLDQSSLRFEMVAA